MQTQPNDSQKAFLRGFINECIPLEQKQAGGWDPLAGIPLSNATTSGTASGAQQLASAPAKPMQPAVKPLVPVKAKQVTSKATVSLPPPSYVEQDNWQQDHAGKGRGNLTGLDKKQKAASGEESPIPGQKQYNAFNAALRGIAGTPAALPPLTHTEIGTAGRNRFLGGPDKRVPAGVQGGGSPVRDYFIGSTPGANRLPGQVFDNTLLAELKSRILNSPPVRGAQGFGQAILDHKTNAEKQLAAPITAEEFQNGTEVLHQRQDNRKDASPDGLITRAALRQFGQ